jgi:V/A-type H+/Na+-transporting ATPase subunit F
MKAFLLSDNIDTQVGMMLAGIKGKVVHERDEVLEALKELQDINTEEDIGIILITEKLANIVREEITKLKLNMDIPLIVEIPDRHGTTRGVESITKYIKESIGLKI